MQICEIADLLEQLCALTVFLFSFQVADFSLPLYWNNILLGRKIYFLTFFWLKFPSSALILQRMIFEGTE